MVKKKYNNYDKSVLFDERNYMKHNLDINFSIEDTVFTVLFIKESRFNAPMAKHSHGKHSYEIHYITDGRGTLIADGKSYELTADTLFTTGPNVSHEQLPDKDDPMNEWCIYIKVGGKCSSDVVREFCRTYFWIDRDKQEVFSILKEIDKELINHQVGYLTNVRSLLCRFIIAMVRNYKNPCAFAENTVPPNIDDSRFLIIEEYFLYNYGNLSLAVLSDILKLSFRQTERILHNYYGKSFSAKKLEARMSAAAILLNDKSKSITEIAAELGYSSASYFCDAFKKYYKMSPSSFRRLQSV